jgi:ubiquitin-like protein Pup
VSGQVQKQKPETKVEEPLSEAPKVKNGDKLKAELDALIDEIDETLEENAEEFVKNYIQKGGQ